MWTETEAGEKNEQSENNLQSKNANAKTEEKLGCVKKHRLDARSQELGIQIR